MLPAEHHKDYNDNDFEDNLEDGIYNLVIAAPL